MKKTVLVCDSCGKSYETEAPPVLVPTGEVKCDGGPGNEKFKVCEVLDLCHLCAVKLLDDVLDAVLYGYDDLTAGVRHEVRILLPLTSTGVVLGGRA